MPPIRLLLSASDWVAQRHTKNTENEHTKKNSSKPPTTSLYRRRAFSFSPVARVCYIFPFTHIARIVVSRKAELKFLVISLLLLFSHHTEPIANWHFSPSIAHISSAVVRWTRDSIATHKLIPNIHRAHTHTLWALGWAKQQRSTESVEKKTTAKWVKEWVWVMVEACGNIKKYKIKSRRRHPTSNSNSTSVDIYLAFIFFFASLAVNFILYEKYFIYISLCTSLLLLACFLTLNRLASRASLPYTQTSSPISPIVVVVVYAREAQAAKRRDMCKV